MRREDTQGKNGSRAPAPAQESTPTIGTTTNRGHRNDPARESPDVEELPSTAPANGHETVDMVNRPGPGEGDDAEKPLLDHDSESQNGGRSMEEELSMQADDDDAGGLPHQRIENRGVMPKDIGRTVPRIDEDAE